MHPPSGLDVKPPMSPPSRGWRIQRFEEVPSTNQTILAAAERGEPEWTVHLARAQSRGRGRGNHSWWSPPGRGLWMSVLLRPKAPPGRMGGLALVAGRAVREALEGLGARGIDLYWPNDLYLGRRKLGGLLGEVRWPVSSPPQSPRGGTGPSQEGREAVVALGIGVNIDLQGLEIPAELRGAVSSLAEAGCRERDPGTIAECVLTRLEPLYLAFEGGAPIPDLVGQAIFGIGRAVRVRLPPAPPWPGVILGIGEGGELLVRRAGGEVHPLRTGEVDYHHGP